MQPAMEPRNHCFGVPTSSHEPEGHIAGAVSASRSVHPARSQNLCMYRVLHRGIDTDRRGRAGVAHPTAGRATVPVEATTVGGARICTLAARPRLRSAGAAKRSARLSAPPPNAPRDVRHRHHQAAFDASQRPRPLTAGTYHTLVGLMAVTGMFSRAQSPCASVVL